MEHTGYRTAAALAAVALSAMAGAAQAQQAPTMATPSGQQTTITAGFTATYDSNVAGSNRELAALRGLQLADQLFQPYADFTLARPVGAQTLFLQGNAGYVFHRVNTILNRQNVDVQGGVNAHYARCQEVVTAEYASFQTDLGQSVVAAPVVKNTEGIQTYNGTVTCGRQIGFAPSVSITETVRDNSAAIEKLLSSNSLSVAPSIAYQQPALGSLAIFGSYTDTNFPHEVIQTPNGHLEGGYTYYAVGVRATRHVGARIAVDASLSYTELDQKIPGEAGFSGLTYSFDVNFAATSRLTAHASVTRATTPSLLPGANFSVSETYSGNVTYLLGPRLTLTLSDTYSIQDYPGRNVVLAGEVSHQKLNDISLHSDYRVNRLLVLGLFASESERSANIPGESYSKVQFGLSARSTF
jgi:hypothetical protein